jgi:hypothetical protein
MRRVMPKCLVAVEGCFPEKKTFSITSLATKHSKGKVSKIVIQNKVLAKLIRSSFQQ